MKINSWKEVIDVIENSIPNYPDITANYIQFRGQANQEWKLEPSILRLVKDNPLSLRKASYYERQATMEFMSMFHLNETKISYKESMNHAAVLVDMQHFSCPTRLLDWSESAYIALYFAVNESFDKDGALFVWDSRLYNTKMKDLHDDFHKVNGGNILEHSAYDVVNIVFATRKNERLVKQRGAFTISNNLLRNHCEMITEVNKDNPLNSGLYKLEIPKELKREFLARLRNMNISADTLFPGLDGLGRSIKEMLILRQWSEDKKHFA